MNKLLFFIGCFTLLHTHLHAITDRYRCIIRDNPATTITIGWDQVSGNNGTVYYDTEDHGKDVHKYTYSAFPDRVVSAKSMNNHYVRLSKLKPSTVYYFVIVDSEGVSKRLWFKTLADNHNERLSIVAGGDSRNYRAGRQNANKMVAKLRPDVVLFAGDMTGGDSDWEWKQWLEDWQLTIAEDGRMTPVIAARGNHERSNQSIVDMFDVKNPDVYYGVSFARGLLRVYTLNSMMSTSGSQRDWLERDLEANQDVAWRIAQYHHPIRPHTRRKSEQEYLRRYWAPLFEKFGVQLAIECDSHMAKVTWPIRSTSERGNDEGFVRDDDKGTVFVGEGGWGAPLRESNDSKRWTKAAGSFNQVKWIFVDLNKIEVRTVKTDNVDEVQSLTDANRFDIPKGIDLWEIMSDTKVDIRNKKRAFFIPREAITLMEISSGKAELVGEKINLTWQSIYEIPNARFKVQVSGNRFFWKTIGVVYGYGAAENKVQKYSFVDKSIHRGGKMYYRIVAIDGLGKEKTVRNIEIRALGGDNMEIVQATYNAGLLSIDIDPLEPATVAVELLDIERKPVFRRAYNVGRGKRTIPINVKYLDSGYYLLELSYNDRLIKKRNIFIEKPVANFGQRRSDQGK